MPMDQNPGTRHTCVAIPGCVACRPNCKYIFVVWPFSLAMLYQDDNRPFLLSRLHIFYPGSLHWAITEITNNFCIIPLSVTPHILPILAGRNRFLHVDIVSSLDMALSQVWLRAGKVHHYALWKVCRSLQTSLCLKIHWVNLCS